MREEWEVGSSLPSRSLGGGGGARAVRGADCSEIRPIPGASRDSSCREESPPRAALIRNQRPRNSKYVVADSDVGGL